VVTIRRRNLLRRFISGYISSHLGFWLGTSAQFYARLDGAYLPPVAVSEAEQAIISSIQAQQRRDQLLSKLSIKKIDLIYEDIFEGNKDLDSDVAFCNWLFMELGYRPLNDDGFRDLCQRHFSPDHYKWANNEVYARIPGSRQLDIELGNDVTGHLFE
jgi:hypothetical protein